MAQFRSGHVMSSHERAWDHNDQEDIRQTHPLPDLNGTPNLTLGLNFIDLTLEDSVGVKVTATQSVDTFTSTIGIWGTGEMSANGFAWLASSGCPHSASGTERVRRTTRWENDNTTCDIDIVFWPASTGDEVIEFADDPSVVVWISGFQMVPDNAHGYEFGGSAAGITRRGFKLRFEKAATTIINGAQLSWVAFIPGDTIRSGVCDVPAIPGYDERSSVSNGIEFLPMFEEDPMIVQAFTKIKVLTAGEAQGFRLKLCDVQPANAGVGIRAGWKCTVGTWSWTVLGQSKVGWVAYIPRDPPVAAVE